MLDKRERKRLRHNIVPNASFKTKHGAINLNLATAGSSNAPGKTYVQIVTQHGRVNVNLVGTAEALSQLSPRAHLDIVCSASKQERLPRNYDQAWYVSSGQRTKEDSDETRS